MRSVTSDVWIGLTDIGAESKFHWVDGTTMDYTNWGWGQPDGNILLPDGVSHHVFNHCRASVLVLKLSMYCISTVS